MLAWPYVEAEKLLDSKSQVVLFETGFGPSGSPTIGTFCEVFRTSLVQRAFEELTGRPTKLVVFSDDLDALRRAPENVPEQEMLKAHLGYSLSAIPDPFGCCESFAAHNNRELRRFLDDLIGPIYEFRSATEMYQTGQFRNAMRFMLDNYDVVRDIILPTLGEERRATYSPFMPIVNGRVLHEGYVSHDAERGIITFLEDGQPSTFPVGGGNCKLQWKADWAMRWMAQQVDYEMAGKDLTDSVRLSSAIVRALGRSPPKGFIYEMFLDAEGHKISKSKGNGLTIDEWLRYGTKDSLACYLYKEPTKAKKLHPEIIPHAVDNLFRARRDYLSQTHQQRQANPVHHVYDEIPEQTPSVTYSMLLNLVKLLGTERTDIIERYLTSYGVAGAEELRALIPLAVNYYRGHVEPGLNQEFYVPTPEEREKLDRFAQGLLNADSSSEEQLQAFAFECGKQMGYADRLRDWFKLLYQTLFGYPDGPRIGLFISIYGRDDFVALLRRKIA